MSLFVLGINHHTAPVAIREMVVFQPGQLTGALSDLSELPDVSEALIVSTCNRTELYCALEHSAQADVRSWLLDYHGIGAQVTDCLYTLEDGAAVTHVFNVASGLDSAILGEPQILGQLKDAYRAAHRAETLGPVLNRLFQQAFSVAKLVRTNTEIGSSPVSVASAAVTLARQIFAHFDRHTALLIGAGQTIELTARHLHSNSLGRMIVANRSVERAHALASRFKGYAIGLDEIAVHLPEADIVICSTGSPKPIIDVRMVKDALKARKRRPMFFVDIAVPRDIHPDVAGLDDVYLYSIDDLKDVVQDNLEARSAAAREADKIVAAEVRRFETALRTLDAVPIIRGLREQTQQIRDEVRAQARKMLASGRPPEEVIDHLTRAMTNKFLHTPSQQLRQAGQQGDTEILRTARHLFDLDEE